MSGHNIYIASSWRNEYQPRLVEVLRDQGHEVYDFRHPAPGNTGFHWSEVDPDWEDWEVPQFRQALGHPVAEEGFHLDFQALNSADVVVLLLPSARSAHVEAAYHRGRGGVVIVHSPEPCQPELMYKMFHAITSTEPELCGLLGLDIPQLQQLSLSQSSSDSPAATN